MSNYHGCSITKHVVPDSVHKVAGKPHQREGVVTDEFILQAYVKSEVRLFLDRAKITDEDSVI